MAEELLVTLCRSDTAGFGFSLLGTAGLPHVIYDIVENSPAADSGKRYGKTVYWSCRPNYGRIDPLARSSLSLFYIILFYSFLRG
ncbi:Similar to Efa6: PH and SEC7 domain-containing protein (Drosophila melanogaster) [Cotesia congregata]|uniref:Similar to Efa6: PH and SEC7 domain-containing protein (Drosophila melanogaster) n=1 Tax=Cotesia congregata TaxID=51543 RepID=A0A8J2MPT4_COTCN|nr:Similar to Efa6: PH and SEC7 domain-containing protein (Drosophila melanogaster) [Cotesia congregata]